MSGFVVSAAFKLVDQFSSQAEKVGSQADKLGSKFDRLKSRAGHLKGLAVGAIGGLIAGFSVHKAIEEAADEERLLGKYHQALQKALPRIAASQAEIEQVISRGSERLGTDYEDALGGVGATMLKFQNLTGRNLLRAIDITFDLAAKSGAKTSGEFEAIAQKVGSSMNNPVRALRAFKGEGAAFTTEQTKMVQAMVKANDLTGAQGILLDGLTKAVGGAASSYKQFQPINFEHNRAATVAGDLWARLGEIILTVAHGPMIVITDYLRVIEEHISAFVQSPFMSWLRHCTVLVEVFKVAIQALATVAFAGLIIQMVSFLGIGKAVAGVWWLITYAIRVATATMALFDAAALLNPYVAGAVAVAAALGAVYYWWVDIKDAISAAWEVLKSFISSIGDSSVVKFVSNIGEASGVNSLSRMVGGGVRSALGMPQMNTQQAAPTVNVKTVVNVDKNGNQTNNTTSSLATGKNLPINVDSYGY